MADVVRGRAGAAISYAQVLAGTKAAQPVMPHQTKAAQAVVPDQTMAAQPVAPVSKPSPQPSPETSAHTRRTASQDSARQKNGAVSSGQPSARVSKASSMENLNPTQNATGGFTMPVGTITL